MQCLCESETQADREYDRQSTDWFCFVAAEYCGKLKAERTQMQEETELLRQEIESLNAAILMTSSRRT